MQFNQTALDAKIKHLDEIHSKMDLVNKVVSRHIASPFTIFALPRVWGSKSAGGGSSLFRVEIQKTEGGKTKNGPGVIFLKVKHRSVLVESKLESEETYSKKSSLQNEYDFLKLLKGTWVPRVIFFDTANEFEFLATEWLTPLNTAIDTLSIAELLSIWQQLEATVRTLYSKGIVHTDIHEHNIALRGRELVLLDFEEAKFLKQELPFSESLDVIGNNRYGDVGDFPNGHGIPGRTCLARLRLVWAEKIMTKMPKLLEQCSFGQDCPYNLDTLQEPDTRIYQSVNYGNVTVAGHRPLADNRPKLIGRLIKKLMPETAPVTYMDIGSNLGNFCLAATAFKNVSRIVGIEADENYVTASRAIAFLKQVDEIEFHRAICGENSIEKIVGRCDVISMFSVYHHIKHKDVFLNDLLKTKPAFLIAEFATQDRFYPERKTLNNEITHIQKALGFEHIYFVSTSGDYSRPIVIFTHKEISPLTLALCKLTMLEKRTLAKTLAKTLIKKLPRKIARRAKYILSRSLGQITRASRSLLNIYRKPVHLTHRATQAIQWMQNNELPSGGLRIHSSTNQAYPEVTGYSIPTLLNWGNRDLAIRLGDWLISIQNHDGSWSDPDGKHPYTFDTGQILKGLLALVDEKPEYKKYILNACDWLLTQQRKDGSLSTPDDTAWGNNVPETIHLYALEPLRAVAEKWNMPKYAQCVQKALGFYLAQPELTNFRYLSHFHAYIIEGLIDLGQKDRAQMAMEEVAVHQKANGAVPAYADAGKNFVCSTGLFQYAICWYKLGDLKRGNKAFDYATKLQNTNGGWYGSYGRGANYFPNEEISWAVKYFLDALYWKIRCEFNATAHIFPTHIDENDGRYLLIENELRKISKQHGDKHREHMNVLDIGCGKGRFISTLKKRNSTINAHGIDISEEILKSVPSEIQTKQGSLLKIPYPNNTFDLCFCIEALEHAVYIEGAIAEMARVTKPGGTLVIVDKNAAKLGQLKLSDWECWFDTNELRDIMQNEGLPVTIHENLPYEKENLANGLFVGWVGKKP